MSEAEAWLDRIRGGDRLALSKAITLMETRHAAHFALRDALIARLETLQVPSFRLAVTGVPGSGKSTLIDRLGLHWIANGHRVAVLAVDPSSHLSHGSILGDKTRMESLSRNPQAFIRPTPTRLHLGGVGARTFETILLCEAAGFDRVLVETVGVGQSETLASTLTDACLLLLVTGTGDDLQGVKKGILEAADLVLVNKADGANAEAARAFSRELRQISSLWPKRLNGEPALILTGSSEDSASVEALGQAIDSLAEALVQNGALLAQRHRQKAQWFSDLVRQLVEERLFSGPDWKQDLDRIVRKSGNPGFSILHQAREWVDRHLHPQAGEG